MTAEITIDKNAGFCFGVVKAIGKAEEELERQGKLYCLGDLVHNNAEVARLRSKGLQVVDRKMFEELHDTEVLIRAHGEPPMTYDVARQHNVRLIDATCPIVLSLQQKVRKGFEEMRQIGGQVVIYGLPGHAEVIGLNGQADNTAIIVSNIDDLVAIDVTKPVRLYSQTTKNREDYKHLAEELKRLMKNDDFEVYDTVCNSVANRAKELEQFAHEVDMLLFVAGEHSSNGRYLYDYCRRVQPNTYIIASENELKGEWLNGRGKIGITGATSTPRWLMEQVMECCEKLLAQKK
ncbi:MAG: 4-hydroxy-3-methylbut-2-enyl diphosphate reductase [Bacteroidales bacterium]|nr:4-hydroxy-3-methylbut-2-enyl diphosphate reductase [Bacteroidales bacterium]